MKGPKKTDILVEDALDLHYHGETWPLICQRLNVSPRVLEKYLRARKHSIDPRLSRMARESRKRPCADCGALCGPSAARCRDCEHLARSEERRFYGVAALKSKKVPA